MKLKMICAAAVAATLAGMSTASAAQDYDYVLVSTPVYFQDLNLRNDRDRDILRIRIDREVFKTCAKLGPHPLEMREQCLREQYPVVIGALPERVQRAAYRT